MHKEGNKQCFIQMINIWRMLTVKLTYFLFDRLQRTLTHRINMATIITGTICNIRRSIDDWRVIGTCFDGLVYKYVVRQKH